MISVHQEPNFKTYNLPKCKPKSHVTSKAKPLKKNVILNFELKFRDLNG